MKPATPPTVRVFGPDHDPNMGSGGRRLALAGDCVKATDAGMNESSQAGRMSPVSLAALWLPVHSRPGIRCFLPALPYNQQNQCTARDSGLASVDYFAQILPHRDITCRHLSF
jgi:hypothetical protein